MSKLFSMPAHSRVWIYASDKPLSEVQVAEIKQEAEIFATGWTAHSKQLKAEADILYNTFLIFMLDESYNDVSGCGIDKSVHFVTETGKKYGLDFFNRMKVQLLSGTGEVRSYSKQQLQELINKGEITGESPAFDNLVQTKTEFDRKWLTTLDKLWISRSLQPA
jgi:hypothetical protein